MTPYPETTEKFMCKFYATLSEKDRRRYAAVEAQKLGHGGITYVAKVLGCAQGTISAGIEELTALAELDFVHCYQRKQSCSQSSEIGFRE